MTVFLRIVVVFLLLGSVRIAIGQPGIQFIENKNQWGANIDYGVRVSGGNMFINSSGFTYYFLDQERIEILHDQSHRSKPESPSGYQSEIIDGEVLTMTFEGSNVEATARPFDKIDTYYNFFQGSDESKWASKANAFEGVYYSSFYDGIDLKLYSSDEFVKYDFIVAPCSDPGQIKLQYAGAQSLSIVDGSVNVRAAHVSILENKPEAFQVIDGKKVGINCQYRLVKNTISFDFPEGYNENYELIIDPILIFSTYSGSAADNWGSTATPGEKGRLYSSGITNQWVNYPPLAGKFPATPGAFQTTYGGIYDVAILKYDSTGQHMLYASYVGGAYSDTPHSLVMNKNNELLVLGTTSSLDFPTSSTAYSKTFHGGTSTSGVVDYEIGSDIFVARISSDGSQLLSSTYLGGTKNDGLNPNGGILTVNYGDQQRGDILSDADGNILVSSVTASGDFPVKNSFDISFGGSTDGIVMKLKPDLSDIIWGAFLGGSFTDAAHTIKQDKSGNIFVGGGTNSTDFPITAGSYQTTQAGSADGWIGKISNDGLSLLSSSFTGTPGFNQVYFLELNAADEVYAYGQTVGGFPVTPGVYYNLNGGQFIQKFTNDLKTLKFSTTFGSGRGIPDISPTAFLVNDCNNIYVSGWGGLVNTYEGYWPGSNTVGMPISNDAYQKTTSGSDFYFMVLTDDASQFLYASYLGGNLSRTHVDGGTSRFDKGGIVYHAVCAGCAAFNATGLPTSDFPTTPGVWSRTNRSKNCNNAAFKFDLSTLKAKIQTNSVELNSPGLNKVCMPDKIVFQNRSIGGKTFLWNLGDGTVITKPDTSAITHQYLAPGQYVIKLKAYDNGTCRGQDSTSTVITVYKPQGKAGGDVVICHDASVQLSASGGTTYAWVDTGKTFTSSNPTPVVSPSDTTKYFVTITDINGCVTKDTVRVSVVPGITVDMNVSLEYKCEDRPSVKVKNLSDSKQITSIEFGDGNSTDKREDSHSYNQDGSYVVRVVGTKEFCIYDKKISVSIKTLFAPNVITPVQSPGFNDFFKIKYGDQFVSDTDITVALVVYDRWGVKVYENSNYQDNWSGDTLAAGTYFYEIEIGGVKVCKSWIQIIK